MPALFLVVINIYPRFETQRISCIIYEICFYPVQINGNHNGYQASMTRIDIYNVRHVKISTNKDDFCLRVELCGEGKVC